MPWDIHSVVLGHACSSLWFILFIGWPERNDLMLGQFVVVSPPCVLVVEWVSPWLWNRVVNCACFWFASSASVQPLFYDFPLYSYLFSYHSFWRYRLPVPCLLTFILNTLSSGDRFFLRLHTVFRCCLYRFLICFLASRKLRE